MSILRQASAVAFRTVSAVALVAGLAHAQGRTITGTYTTVVNSPQGPVPAVIVLKKENGKVGGTLAAEGFPVLPVASVTATDSTVAIQADSPDGGVVVTLKFGANNKVSGTVLYQGAEMPVEGTFAAEAAGSGSEADDARDLTGRLVSLQRASDSHVSVPSSRLAGGFSRFATQRR